MFGSNTSEGLELAAEHYLLGCYIESDHGGADILQIGTVKLFNKWSYEDVEVKDISLT